MRYFFITVIASLILISCSTESKNSGNHKTDTTATAKSTPKTKSPRPKEPTKEETQRDSVILVGLFSNIVNEARLALKSNDFSEIAPHIAARNLKGPINLSDDIDVKTVEHFCNQIAEAIPESCPLNITHVVTGYIPEGAYASFQINCGGNPIPCGFIKVNGKYLYAGLSNE